MPLPLQALASPAPSRQTNQGRALAAQLGARALASRDLKVGDRLQLQERGSIEVMNIERTKRERWRVDILRQ